MSISTLKGKNVPVRLWTQLEEDHAVLDEIPGAYKDIDQVMQYQQDLVEIVAELKQVMYVKG
jgi:tRNA-splicing ligase RtcB